MPSLNGMFRRPRIGGCDEPEEEQALGSQIARTKPRVSALHGRCGDDLSDEATKEKEKNPQAAADLGC
jgi:hypothetical protein